MEQDIEKENKRLRDLLYSKIMFIEQLKKDYRNLVKDIEEIIKNYNEARDLAIELRDAHETVRKEFLRADKNKDMWREKAERLREENNGLKSQLDFEIQRRAVAEYSNELLEDEHSELVLLCENYRTTLQEIRAIAENIMTSDTEKWTLDEPFKQIDKILDLITKAEEE